MNRAQRRAAGCRGQRGSSGLLRMVAELLVQAQGGLQMARAMDPEADYSARVYGCQECGTIDAAVGPRDELGDAYECPACGAMSEAWTECAP